MMNCFEARQDFASFWRHALGGERRRELLGHLKECAKCDRAFRAFALTAPLLHASGGPRATAVELAGSATRHDSPRSAVQVPPQAAAQVPPGARTGAPINLDGVRSASADRAAEILRRASVYRLAERRPAPAWRAAAAACSAVAAAVLLAYFSVAAPAQSFDEALVGPDSISETAVQPDTDFLGQQIPTLPAVSNDLAG
jgi:hypothetical protein